MNTTTDDREFVFAPVHSTKLTVENGELYEESLTPACDFCLDTRVRWEYPCATFTLPEIRFGSDDGWLSCERCADRIEARDLGGLTARSLRSWTIRMGAPPTEMVDGVGLIQHGFLDHRSGPRLPHEPY